MSEVCRHKGTHVSTTPGRRLWAVLSLGAGSSYGIPQAGGNLWRRLCAFVLLPLGIGGVGGPVERVRGHLLGLCFRRRLDFFRLCLFLRHDRFDLGFGLLVLRLGLGLRCGLRLGLGRGDRIELLLRGQLAALGHDRDLQRGGHVGEELDRDLVAPDPLDRLGHVELAPVDAHPLGLPELLGDVGRGDRAEERAGLTCGNVEAQLCAFDLLRDLLGLLEALRLMPRALLLVLAQLGHLGRRGRLGELARQQVVPRVAGSDVHDLAAKADLLEVLSEDDLHRHLAGGVREERHLARPLDREGDLPLMAPAGAGDSPRADLALLGDVATKLVCVLVVHLRDLLAAEVAVPFPDRAARSGPALALLSLVSLGHQKGMSSSAAAVPKSAFSAVAPLGTNCGCPPSAPSGRPPRNWTLSAMISTAWRFVPSWASHSRQSSRPSTATGRPFARYCAQLSPWLPQTVTSK